MNIAVALALLAVGALLASLALQRVSDRLARRRQSMNGVAFDASLALSRLSALRKNFVAELQSHERGCAYQERLLQSARATVARLPFFRARVSETELAYSKKT